MDANYMLACGIVWRKTADPKAGWELVEALESPDPSQRFLAQALLIETGEDSMDLLEGAVASGIVSPGVAGPCMAEILRSGKARQIGKQTIKQHLVDVSLC
ncbi:MAG: hypothetical protein WCC22_14890 [Terriglobales bacterium]